MNSENDVQTLNDSDDTVLRSYNDIKPSTGVKYDGWNLTCKETLDTDTAVKKG